MILNTTKWFCQNPNDLLDSNKNGINLAQWTIATHIAFFSLTLRRDRSLIPADEEKDTHSLRCDENIMPNNFYKMKQVT